VEPIIRKLGVLANVTTAAAAAAPLWAPLWFAPSGGRAWQWWLVGAVSMMLVAREVLMDVRDRAGDAAGGRTTLATRHGAGAASRLGVGLTFAATVPFVAAIVLAGPASPGRVALALGLAGAIAYLLVVPAARIVAPAAAIDGATIQAYVLRSRAAMALLPALALLLALR